MTNTNTPLITDTATEQELSQKLSLLKQTALEEEKKKEAQKLGVPFVNLTKKNIQPSVISILPEETARHNQVVVCQKDLDIIVLAAIEPTSEEVRQIKDQLYKQYNIPVEIALTTEEGINSALTIYNQLPKKTEGVQVDEAEIEEFQSEIVDYREIKNKIYQVSLSQLLNIIFAAALKVNSSDIHFQPQIEGSKIRFRIDGVLRDVVDLDKEKYIQIKKRLKLISKIKINIEDKPQDGAFDINLAGNKIDVRVSTLPTNYGESIVMRMLSTQTVELEFSNLGFREDALEILQKQVAKPNGMILACGPTGSGKTTTLYTILKKLNTEETQIVTLEDPIEYKLQGITQTQIESSKMGFAQGLRAILRQDPDIIMVGEIRDLETAETAINAALTGHLVISTIHTNNAPAAIPRLLAMGVKPFLLAPALNLVIGQRLARKICDDCKIPFNLPSDILEQVKQELAKLPPPALSNINLNNLTFYIGRGCPKCSGLGLKGRIGLYELFQMDEEINAVIQTAGLSEYKIQELAKTQGMVTMVQDGLLKALDGITSVEEVYRVIE